MVRRHLGAKTGRAASETVGRQVGSERRSWNLALVPDPSTGCSVLLKFVSLISVALIQVDPLELLLCYPRYFTLQWDCSSPKLVLKN